MCSPSGNGSAGGTTRNAKKPPSCLGAAGRNSRYQRRISPERSSGHSMGPPMIVSTGCRRNRNEVTTPKFPPPPRIAQKRSECSSSLVCTRLPSASTTSAPSRLSIDSPYPRARCPTPPPSVRPPTPVVETIPLGVASPKPCVAWSTSLHLQPPSARTVRAPGSTRVPLMAERSTTSPPSQLPKPAPLCPPPLIASFRPCAWA